MGGLFGKPPDPVAPPKQAPDPDNEGPEAKEARRRRMAKLRGQGGRASTILTGAGDYSGKTMG